MYIFVRITAVIFMIIGILLMLAAIVYGIIAVVAAFTDPPGLGPVVPGFGPLLITTGGGLLISLGIFLQGLITTAFGQLMIVFTDIARHTNETVSLLRFQQRPVKTVEVETPPVEA